MEFKEYLDKVKEKRDAIVKTINDEYKKGYISLDSALYGAVQNFNLNGRVSLCEFKEDIEKNKLPLNKKRIDREHNNRKITTIHTDNVYLTKIDYIIEDKVYPFYEGYINVLNSEEQQESRYVRCYARKWDNETAYDFVTIQVSDKDFFSPRVYTLGSGLPELEVSCEKELFTEIENIFEQEEAKCSNLASEKELGL